MYFTGINCIFDPRCPDGFASFFKLDDIDYEESKEENMSQLLQLVRHKINQDQTFDDHKLFIRIKNYILKCQNK